MTARSRGSAIAIAFAVMSAGIAVAVLPMPSSSAAVNCGAVAAWAEGGAFTAGQEATYNGRLYRAIVAHTAWHGAGWNPAATPGLWRDVDSCGMTNPTAPHTSLPTTAPTKPPTTPPATPPVTTPPPTNLPKHALIGYHHTSFPNEAGYLPLADVPAAWDVINLSFGVSTAPASGDIRLTRCPVNLCPNVESDAEFIAAVQAKRQAGTKVLLSIGGADAPVRLETAAARDRFVSSVSAIIDRYGLDGIDIDFEGHSLFLDAGDTDFKNPTTAVIVNLIAAVKALKARYGSGFILTMAPETYFVQAGYEFYGRDPWGGPDPRGGAYLPVIHALRDDLTVLHVQLYNSGAVMGLDDRYHENDSTDFHIALTDMLLTGFPVARDRDNVFAPLREDQVALGVPAAAGAANGHYPPAAVQQAVTCLVKGTGCGSYQPRSGTNPDLRGLMTWSITWDAARSWEFANSHEPFLNSLGR